LGFFFVAKAAVAPSIIVASRKLSVSMVEVRRKLELAQANLDHYRKLAEHPNLSFRAAQAARNMATSYQAAVTLYQKALQHERRKENLAGNARG
jgi:hypothetical protein